jgi:hypothetical protein
MLEAFRKVLPPAPPSSFESPGLGAGAGQGAAYELKFHLTEIEATAVEAWARHRLTPDPHGRDGAYDIVSIYHDTPRLDVFHRSTGFRRNKFRVRRYDEGSFLFLERKTRRGDRVRKRRVSVPLSDLPFLSRSLVPESWQGAWFHRRLCVSGLRPTCKVAYQRTAFFGKSADGPLRLTLDRGLVGAPAHDWHVSPVDDGVPLLPEGVLLEMKFHVHMPALFRELLPHLPCQPARVSKYRRCIELCQVAEAQPEQEPGVASVGDLLRVLWVGSRADTMQAPLLPRTAEGA